MLHRSRKTKSLRRNQRGAAVRDRDVTQPLRARRQRWPGRVCLQGGTVQGSGARRGAGSPGRRHGSRWARGECCVGGDSTALCGSHHRDTLRAGSAPQADSTCHPSCFQLAAPTPLWGPLLCAWAGSSRGQYPYGTEHRGDHQGSDRLRQQQSQSPATAGYPPLPPAVTHTCNIDFLGIGRKSFAVA